MKTAQEFIDKGYRRTSVRYRMVSRIDRPDWKEVLAASHVNGMEWVNLLLETPGSAEDHYRRCHSQDKIEDVPQNLFNKIPGSGFDECGYKP